MRSSPWIVVLVAMLLSLAACGDDGPGPPPPGPNPFEQNRILSVKLPCREGCLPSTLYKGSVDMLWYERGSLDLTSTGGITMAASESGSFGALINLTPPESFTRGQLVTREFFYRCEGDGGRLDFQTVTCPAAPDIVVITEVNTELGNGGTTGVGTKDANGEFPYTFTLKTSRPFDLVVSSTAITAHENCNASLALSQTTIGKDQSAALTLTITPLKPGPFKVTVSIASNDPDENPFVASVEGQVAAVPQPEINVVGPAGQIAHKGTSPSGQRAQGAQFTQEITVQNLGLSVLSVFGETTATGDNCTCKVLTSIEDALTPQTGVTTFTVSVTPTGPGAFKCPVSIDNDDADENPYLFDITGTVPSAPDIAVGSTQDIPNGSSNDVGSREAEKAFELSYLVMNEGNATLTITGASIPIATTNCSAAITQAPPATLAPGASATIKISVLPGAIPGPFDFAIHIDSDDPDAEKSFGFTVAGVVTNPCAHPNPMKLIEGKKIYRVPVNVGCSGDKVCAAAGLACAGVPVLSAVSGACLAFHPGTQVTSDLNGWKQSVYCDGTATGLACNAGVSCHDCPACGSGGLACNDPNSSQLSELYVECK